ncbi:hypothetical protein [Microbacterium sp.]|uniref:hypothetical protein n=1 Tax=Microbacterium sp. TaxID=51671 RepID=UPI0028127C3B|nr:hypothetical protein [Microbacterium sp.]
MMHNPEPVHIPAEKRRPLGLSVLSLIALAALGLPRVILHDLHIIDEAHPASWILSLGPVAVWVAVAVVKKVPNPFLTVLTIGLIFAVMLSITHQLLWSYAFADSETAQSIPRLAQLPGGLFAGLLLGGVGGLVAWGIRAVMKQRTRG